MSNTPENPPVDFPSPKIKQPRSDHNIPYYAELQCVSNFSFLRGGSHPAELIAAAKALGINALGIADRNSVAGVVRAHAAAKKENIKLIVGARIDTVPNGFHPQVKGGRNEKLDESEYADAPPGFSCIIYPTDRAAWGRLCTLLSKGKLRAQKGNVIYGLRTFYRHLKDRSLLLYRPRVELWMCILNHLHSTLSVRVKIQFIM